MLFFKECKKVLFSLTFLIYLVAVIAMYVTQFQNDCDAPLPKPQPGQSDYGTIAKEIPELLMPEAIESLVTEYLSGSFVAYPIGFYKNVRLNKEKKQEMAEIIAEVSGIPIEQLDNFDGFQEGQNLVNENGEVVYLAPVIPDIHIPESLTYECFRELMHEADAIIGGGSYYSDASIVGNFSQVPKTYEDALAEYEDFLNKDKITGAYARLYCDYMGIVIAILPVFVAVSLAVLDRKSRMEQLAYARKISSAKLIFTRFMALTAVMLLPVIITSIMAQIRVSALYPNSQLDHFAIFRYAAIWLIPNITTATAVGMLVTEVSSSMLAIFVQGVWWFSSIFASTSGLTGNIKMLTLVIRHNSLYGLDLFVQSHSVFLCNRIFFAVISLAAIALTAYIYELKRRGIFNGYFIRIHIPKYQSET